MKFHSLGDKTVVEAGVTDHNVVIEGSYATFNLLVQCQNYGYHYNNGFKIEETNAQYADRLFNKTIPVLQEMYENGVRIFLLQEAPALHHLHGEKASSLEQQHYVIADEFYIRLQEAIPQLDFKNASYSKNWGSLDSGGLLTLVDKQFSEHMVNTTEEMQSFVSQGNQNRFQSFTLKLNDSNPTLLKIANFHADFATQDGTKADIEHFVHDHYVVGGDFNLINLPLMPELQPIHIISDITIPGMMPIDTYDALFFGNELHTIYNSSPTLKPIAATEVFTKNEIHNYNHTITFVDISFPILTSMHLEYFEQVVS